MLRYIVALVDVIAICSNRPLLVGYAFLSSFSKFAIDCALGFTSLRDQPLGNDHYHELRDVYRPDKTNCGQNNNRE